jgi:hypothetical protein
MQPVEKRRQTTDAFLPDTSLTVIRTNQGAAPSIRMLELPGGGLMIAACAEAARCVLGFECCIAWAYNFAYYHLQGFTQ